MLKEHTHADLSQRIQGHIRIGSIASVGKTHLPSILIPFLRDHPHVTISMEYIGTNTLCDRVLHDELDIGIGPVLPNETTGLRKESLFVEKVGLLIPDTHWLAQAQPLTLSALENCAFILSEPLNAYRAALEQRFAELGFHLKPKVELGDSDTIIKFVQGGIGVALLPVSLVQALPPNTVFREMEDAELHLTIGLIRKEKRVGDAVAALHAILKDKLADLFEGHFPSG
ncbi:DNA-binding transcriptional LysR family regulator [Paenibacillus phyllosphaerae]|uniref:DNA-binding transcriptional LysR family regulator n=1 Tax=Paenibacillus phyllosphaerae TaxID=274593 RepID=A0A7W5AXK6_9BACL|nr:LysR family transcriptional regulator substrate-binding protein [Paenibacillus phyllosphaerae]MBB3110116.1 DNA-binding transcriptional LysR family regulator [Paenibacillus phyllosphaerae]